MNFLRYPIWGITGRLSLRQSHDAREARSARLATTGEIDTAQPLQHVLEGHADKNDLLGWAIDVTSRGRKEKREVEEMMERCPSPLRRRTVVDYEGVYRRQNAKARMEREVEMQKCWTPRDVTHAKHDSGIGTPGNQTENEKMKEGGNNVDNDDKIEGGEMKNTNERNDRDITPVGISKAEMEAEIKHIKDAKDAKDQTEKGTDAKKLEKVEEHVVRAIGEMQDVEDAKNKQNITATKHARVAVKLGRDESETIANDVIQPKLQNGNANQAGEQPQPAQKPTEKWAKGNEGVAARNEGGVSPKSVKIGSVVTSLDGAGDDVKISEQEVKSSIDPDMRNERWAQGKEGEAARTVDDVSPKSGTEGKPIKISDSRTGQDSLGAAKGEVEKWVKGTEGEEARNAGGVSPKGVPIGSAIMSGDAAGCGKTGEEKEGHFGKKQTAEEGTAEEGAAEEDAAEKATAQARTEKWVKGTEGEEARNAGGVSPKSVRSVRSVRSVSATMSRDGARNGTDTEDCSVSMKSAKSKVTDGEQARSERSLSPNTTRREAGGQEELAHAR